MIVATCAALASLAYVAGSALPAQVHIALAGADEWGNSNAMAVSWQTETDTATSKVQYGIESGVYSWTAEGSSSSCSHFLFNASHPHFLLIIRL